MPAVAYCPWMSETCLSQLHLPHLFMEADLSLLYLNIYHKREEHLYAVIVLWICFSFLFLSFFKEFLSSENMLKYLHM